MIMSLAIMHIMAMIIEYLIFYVKWLECNLLHVG